MNYEKIREIQNEILIKTNQAYKLICDINSLKDKIEIEYQKKKAGE